MKYLLFLFLVAIVVYACQKEFSFTNSTTREVVSLDRFFKKNAAPLQRFEADASDAIAFTAAKGTGVNVPANAFVTMTGAPVTGKVTVAIKELYTPAEMILNNRPTTSNGWPLISGGAFFIQVTKNNEELRLTPGKYIQLDLATAAGADMNGMLVFTGENSSTGTANWIADTSQNSAVIQDSLSPASAYLFTDKLQWINCDKFINEPKITFTVNAGNCPNPDSAFVFVHLTGLPSVVSLPLINNRFTSDFIIAANATVVGICVIDKKIYYSMIPVAMQHNGSVTLNFFETGEDELKEKLATLN